MPFAYPMDSDWSRLESRNFTSILEKWLLWTVPREIDALQIWYLSLTLTDQSLMALLMVQMLYQLLLLMGKELMIR